MNTMASALPFDADLVLVVLLACGLAVVHLIADEIQLFEVIPRRYVLSAAGGVSTVYVFVYLLPSLDEQAITLEGVDLVVTSIHEHHIYSFAFVGFALFYGLERLAQVSKRYGPVHDGSVLASEPVFAVRISSFCIYNAFIGYVLVVEESGSGGAAFALAMGLHLLGNDEAMRKHHRNAYHRIGRWVLAAAVLFGAGAGFVVEVGSVALVALLALLTGGIVFNAIKEELPGDRDGSFWAFVGGAGGYALLLAILL